MLIGLIRCSIRFHMIKKTKKKCLPHSTLQNYFKWISRNQRIFENRQVSSSAILTKALQAAREWELAQYPTGLSIAKPPAVSSPGNLPTTTIICNTDGAWKEGSAAAGTGWIFSNSEGEIGRGGKTHYHVASPILAEALAIRDALLHGLSLGFTSIWLRSDA